jgi:hypothetical protein
MTCAAVAPEVVLTVRMYDTTPFYEPRLNYFALKDSGGR